MNLGQPYASCLHLPLIYVLPYELLVSAFNLLLGWGSHPSKASFTTIGIVDQLFIKRQSSHCEVAS